MKKDNKIENEDSKNNPENKENKNIDITDNNPKSKFSDIIKKFSVDNTNDKKKMLRRSLKMSKFNKVTRF